VISLQLAAAVGRRGGGTAAAACPNRVETPCNQIRQESRERERTFGQEEKGKISSSFIIFKRPVFFFVCCVGSFYFI
jgi:hypothetical protein